MDELDAACVRLPRSAFQSAAVRAPPACAHRAACPVQPWELRRRGAACLLVLYCRDRLVHRHFQDVAGTATAVHPDAVLARHQDGPAAHYSDDIVETLHQSGACLAAHRDVIGLVHHQALPDVPDSAAVSKVRQLDEELPALPPQDGLPQARFPVQRQAAAARQAAVRKERAQLQDV